MPTITDFTFNDPAYAAPADVPTPRTVQWIYFFDTTNSNLLSYMDNSRTVFVVTDLGDCCSCIIATDISKKMACALADGMFTLADFTTFLVGGINVTSTESIIDGVKTCSVTIKKPA